jgi:uncharacterized membrane protein
MHYSQPQLLLTFFTYCFLGWIWESLFVSFQKREWVNRGFLHGPMLPIYGFGAIIILWLTLPFRDSLPLIYIIGMLGATILEYATGAVMERIFRMRYWDYRGHPFNLNGHISLFTSLVWGLFSILLVKSLHPPIENLLLAIPSNVLEPVSLIILICFVVDTTNSIQAGLNMKELMAKLTDSNESFALLDAKLAAVAASISLGSEEFQRHLQRIEVDRKEDISQFRQRMETKKKSRQAFLLEKLQERRDKNSRVLVLLNEKVDATIQEVQAQMRSAPIDYKKTRLDGILTELYKFKDGLKEAELNMAARKDKEYKVAANLVRRNPTSVSSRFQEVLMEIKSLNEPRVKHHGYKNTK